VRWGFLAVLLVIAVARAPYVLARGRFWAEEGSLHFAHMYNKASFPGELFYVQTRTGYYNLFANAGTWLASNGPLVYAPLITAWLSFGVLALLLWVALCWPSDLLPNAVAKLAAATLLLVGTLANTEVWLNTINAQTYLGLLTVLLLFVRVEDLSRLRFGIGVTVLMIAGLSGLYSAVLFPLFVIVALVDRSRRRWCFAVPLALTAVIQTSVVLSSGGSGQVAESKLALPGFGDAFRNLAGSHLGGLLTGRRIGRLVDDASAGSTGSSLALAVIGITVLSVIVVLLWRAPNRRVSVLLAAAFLSVEVLVQVGALSSELVGRYTVVPIGILTLMLVYGVFASWPPQRSWRNAPLLLGAGVLAVVLVVGVADFWRVQPRQLRCIECPVWADEVEKYEGDGSPPEIWPYDRDEPWVVPLRHP
jgi:hypothetical protein